MGRHAQTAEAALQLVKSDEKGDKTALQALEELVTDFHRWQAAREALKRLNRETGEALSAAQAALQEAIEAPLPAKANPAQTTNKLERIEVAWQDLLESKAHRVEMKKGAKDEVREAAEKLDRSVKAASQMILPGFN